MKLNRRTFAWGLVLLGLSLVLIWGMRVGGAAWRLWRQLNALSATSDQADLSALCRTVAQMDADLRLIEHDAGALIAAADRFPAWTGVVRDAPELFSVARTLAQAGQTGCTAFAPLLEGDSVSLPRALEILATHRDEFSATAQALAQAQEAWARVDAAALPPRLARKAALLDQALPLAQAAFDLASVAPDLLGMDGPRTYLIQALNESELRPGGGFISGLGEVTLRHGELEAMTFYDSYAVDNFRQPYPEAPDPLRRYMGIDLLVYRDSNWWPDFPAAVQAAWPLFRPATPKDFDGVIAVDQRALELLVSAVGELTIPDSDVPLTAQNVRDYIRRSWEPPQGDPTAPGWWSERKAIMGPLAEALWQRIKAGTFDKARLAYVMLVILREKHVQIALEQPRAAAVLRARGWDGSLPHELPGDFVMLVDANVGYNKVNERVRQAVTYTVDLRPAAPLAELRAVYTNTVTRAVPCEPQLAYPPTYQQMIERCYWDYIRVYAHPQAELQAASTYPIPASALLTGQAEDGAVVVGGDPLGHWRVFSGLMLLPTGSVQERFWRWSLPATVVEWRLRDGSYRLRLQKQAGASPYPATVRVLLPPGVSVTRAVPAPAAHTADGVTWQVTLDRDYDFVLELRRP